MTDADCLTGKTVIVRLDLSNPLDKQALAQIGGLAGRGARVAIVSGYGNPEGDFNAAFTLRSFVDKLQDSLERPVTFIPECVGARAESGLDSLPPGGVALLENVRFHPDFRRHSRTFALRLSALGDFFAVPGGIPENAAVWINELAKLLPSPATPPIHQPERT